MDPSGSSPREGRGCTEVEALLRSVNLLKGSSGNLSENVLARESKK